jgi:hypothetical protein
MLIQKSTTIKADKKGYYIIVSGKKIRFEDGVIDTPVNLPNRKYLGDYRAYDGIHKGATINLAIYTK